MCSYLFSQVVGRLKGGGYRAKERDKLIVDDLAHVSDFANNAIEEQCVRASLSDSNRQSISSSRTGPLTFLTMDRVVSSMNSTLT